ncbi:MAG: trehalose-phosphatase [Pseudomonadota bacterium]
MLPPLPDLPAFFLDFDGTLVDLVGRPQDVVVATDLPDLIADLVARYDGAVAVVTGRKLSDVDSFLKVSIAGAGMHGLERRSAPGGDIAHAPPPDEIATLRERILSWQDLGNGVSMEDKGAGLAIHYRAAPERESEVKTVMNGWLEDLSGLHLLAGKMVVEAKGKGFDKGSAVAEFMAMPPFSGKTPIFVGDDVTDEDGMRAAQAAGGFGVKVGEGPTVAPYRLENVTAVHDWLRLAAAGPA